MDIQVVIITMIHVQDVMVEAQLQLHHVHTDIVHHIDIVTITQIQQKDHIHIAHMVIHHNMIKKSKILGCYFK